MTNATLIKLSESMGLDSHHPKTEITPQAPESVAEKPARATTASMQSLLAHYFESNAIDPKVFEAPHFEAERVHTLSSTQSETRAASPADILGTQATDAAFVPATPAAAPSSPSSLVAQPDWPAPARALIDSLMRENESLREQLQQQALHLQSAQGMADSDVLTPTLNRRAFLREVHRAMADCRRYGEEACLLYLDMDDFKSINDAYGHSAGDAALVYVAETLNASVREGDSVGRIGGDEFAILLRHADLKSSRIKAMRLEAELMMGTYEYAGLFLKAGGSFGVRAYAAQASAEAWLSEADAAMFLVKKASR
ncbi:GGDEF domain-containing protein [Asticcacaulis sp.]|uniref:GGDEF domain-containing protein n=1 Tax=Asticcacaulis sp. TaxID=1872648 RepID=UPI002CE7A57F|nr:GGDEF domain-containing protein [Asticcacaulis sp.]HTM83113.1 GGDEF domain-containing protein [Asticcacaulis sp.]